MIVPSGDAGACRQCNSPDIVKANTTLVSIRVAHKGGEFLPIHPHTSLEPQEEQNVGAVKWTIHIRALFIKFRITATFAGFSSSTVAVLQTVEFKPSAPPN